MPTTSIIFVRLRAFARFNSIVKFADDDVMRAVHFLGLKNSAKKKSQHSFTFIEDDERRDKEIIFEVLCSKVMNTPMQKDTYRGRYKFMHSGTPFCNAMQYVVC